MTVITKETAMMSYLYNSIYHKREKNFIDGLEEELQTVEFKELLDSADEKTKKLFEAPFSVKEIKSYLKEAKSTFTKLSEQNRNEISAMLSTFESGNLVELYFLDEDEIIFSVRNSGAFFEDYYSSVFRKITFENSQVTLNGNPLPDGDVQISYDTVHMFKQKDTYVLEYIDYFQNEHYVINFDSISVILKAYKADDDDSIHLFLRTPWEHIEALAYNINEHFTYGIANEKEKKIFGIVKHLVKEKYVDNSIPAELYELIKKHRLQKVIRPPYDFSRSYLCEKRFEPLWRDIFALISESQKGLPSYYDETIPEADFENHKQLITERMNKWGYTGTYPDFYKKDRLMKPTLFKTYGLTYINAFEKFVEHHIHCYSYSDGEIIQTVFLVGTIFNKRSDDKTDIYSTMFNCGGRAVFSVLSTTWVSFFCDCSYDSMTRMAVKAAVKRANLQKADKDDRMFRNIGENHFKPNYGLLILSFVLFTVGFSLIFPLLSIILDGDTLSEVAAAVKEEPVLAAIGPIGSFAATSLLALFDYLSGKK